MVEVYKGCVLISPPNKSLVTFGHLEFHEICIVLSVQSCCKHIFPNNLLEIENNFIHVEKETHQPFVTKINIHWQEEFL